uniref:Uncharacterized protein n=1 Tax=Entomoneis paludosa TaxID=265537 RepID=A0A7S2VE51_9STRA|mmetsp:Transcript_18956/g.39241  ORF Transcript_18956/g.39241 Transcript_18956/m.39241 type:complete len:211 (+) Transcript_18956:61-693(+)
MPPLTTRPTRRAWLLLFFVSIASTGAFHAGLSFTPRPTRSILTLSSSSSTDGNNKSRRSVLQSWTQTLLVTAVATTTTTVVRPTTALAKAPKLTQEQAFDALRQQLYDREGSVAQLQLAIEHQDYTALLDMTKEMDQTLRKQVVGSCKYYVQANAADQAQQLSNNVTFDLIGMNKSARPNQRDLAQAQRYLQELTQDLEQMLALEPKEQE